MARIRIIFEKRGLITFLNHQDLPVLFSRAARRAGLRQEFTEGFSPHPRMSLGPALVGGVEGRNEPADFWFLTWDEGDAERWNEKLPVGIRISDHAEVDGPSLSKLATAAVYRISGVGYELGGRALSVLGNEAEKSGILYGADLESGSVLLTVGDLEHCGAGNLVRSLRDEGICEGWKDLYIVRECVGTWDAASGTVRPLI
jgi:hypothetical protein